MLNEQAGEWIYPDPSPPMVELNFGTNTKQMALNVAAHYDERQHCRNNKEPLDEKIRTFRKVNNWIKSLLIRNFSRDAIPRQASEEATEAVRCPEELQSLCFLRRRLSDVPPTRRGRPRRGGGSVLDIGCGRGGDVSKWLSSYSLSLYDPRIFRFDSFGGG